MANEINDDETVQTGNHDTGDLLDETKRDFLSSKLYNAVDGFHIIGESL
jgi:hypothetical protein